jgi:hypothetical protein
MLEPLPKTKPHEKVEEWIKLTRDLCKIRASEITAIEAHIETDDFIPDWGSFDRPWTQKRINSLSESQIKQGLLAAISVMPLKDLYQEMISLDNGAGDFAHPIYDNDGTLRWPK